MITKEFLEKYPLLKKLHVTYKAYSVGPYGVSGTTKDLPKVPLNLFCDTCSSDQTFNMENEYVHFLENNRSYYSPIGKTYELIYKCAGCNKYRYYFYVEFERDSAPKVKETKFSGWIRKVGQTPPWEINIDKDLEKVLGSESELYKKGLINESQNYGIGAYAYYRRITEKIIDELLESIIDLVDEENKEEYKKKLEEIKKIHQTERKIELVQDLLPSSLMPEGSNPLKALHSVLSEGLHSKTDEACLKLAESIKEILIFLIEEVRSKKARNKTFTKKMKDLLGQN